MKRTLSLVAVVTFSFAFFAVGAQAGDGPGAGPFEAVLEYKLFDRPDLLNFDPFHATSTFGGTESFTFTSMGVDYTTSLAIYSDYGYDCFSDPDPDKMLDENILCVRAGHRRIDAQRVYAVEYALNYVFSYNPYWYSYLQYYGQGFGTAFFEGLFGSEVYLQGYFHVMTADGGEVSAEYWADIPDKLVRKDNKIKFKQQAFVDFGADVWDTEGGFLGGFGSWFETCGINAAVKGVAAPVVGPMLPPNKQGTLDKVKAKLDCDQDAVDAMVSKLEDDAGEVNAAAATSIFRAALAKLGKDTRLKLRVKDKDGTEVFFPFDDDDMLPAAL